MPDVLADGRKLSVYLAYGWLSPDGKDIDPDIYPGHALGIARELCECLRDGGFEPFWNGDLAKKIHI